MQAAIYLVLWALSALVFSLWWHRSFAKGIHWNLPVAVRWCLLLAGLGLVTGLAITLAGNFLPMPKAPPILEDLTKSAAGAWALTVFGVTLAPLTEELAFRGFLLPSLVNIFRWLERKNIIGDTIVRTIGIPLSIVLTSIPFAFMHAAQVSNSWGPVLLIGLVSVILCIVRLTTDSVAAGVVVHACYNFTLFAGLLYQTDWYRHLDKLKG
jgi:membrane protease YdiL (CAAX protease family)